MITWKNGDGKRRQTETGVTMVEFLVSMMIAGFAIASIIGGYILASQKTEWSTASSAAQRLALQRIEQARAARWDFNWGAPWDAKSRPTNLTRLAGSASVALQLPETGGNPNLATVRTTVTTNASPPLCIIRVEVIWTNMGRGPFTNTVIAYRAPDS
jgi:type II secretory pathway pseudopilin PulG